MITGLHAILYSKNAEKVRAFMRDTLGFEAVDAGGGWLIFAMPPTELAAHPSEGELHSELYLMCDDIHKTVEELTQKGVQFAVPVKDQGWGLLTTLIMPGGDHLGLYQPKHPTAIGRG